MPKLFSVFKFQGMWIPINITLIGICSQQIFSTFMHTEYGGPGTLLVEPFIDMADTLNERGLPGGPQAARAAVKWAQDCVDKDWKEWNGN